MSLMSSGVDSVVGSCCALAKVETEIYQGVWWEGDKKIQFRTSIVDQLGLP